MSHHSFTDFPAFLQAGDVLVLNDSRVIPARLRGLKPVTGGKIEALLCQQNSVNDWWALLRPAKRLRPGERFELVDRHSRRTGIPVLVMERNVEGHVRLAFECPGNILHDLDSLGELPLPPYIHRGVEGPSSSDLDRYQTVYAASSGSLAAPTAGLHYTTSILDQIRGKGVQVVWLTLHVGLGTFAPVKSELIEDHPMHEEQFDISPATAESLNAAIAEKRRIVAGGTTSLRVLESVAGSGHGRFVSGRGSTRIFIRPPCAIAAVGALQTNFHLPQSTLLMLVSAFASPGSTCGIEWMLDVYREAIREGYRFFSYGDTMLIQ